MLIRLSPVVITTREAFEGILEDGAIALYITAKVYLEMYCTIRAQLRDHGFAEWLVGRRGVIYVQTQGPYSYDPARHRMFLPIEFLE